jgi:hypothetical protein
MTMYSRPVVLAAVLLLAAFCSVSGFAQDLAALSGRVTDPKGLPVPGVKVQAVNVNTNEAYPTETNEVGLYNIPTLPPGTYRIIVEKQGFVQIVKPGVELHVADIIAINFALQIGSVTQSVTVEAGAPMINTTDASVGTVVDRQFAENLPLNGRSFQTLLYLTPGVTPNSGSGAAGFATGQFTVNGQRASSNYWTVDGVSANIGMTPLYTPGGGSSGSLGSFNVLGGTNSLVSVDALQEFRIQTSTYAPEFGRTPGGQISIVTRSGTNQFHGSAFNYLRNTVLDATDWFADANGLPKGEERQNDFGGTFGGRVVKDKTFFFFSYEGLRLRLPQTALTTVPDLAARQNALPAVQPFLSAFPLPNPGKPDITPGVAPFDSSFSNPATLDAYSLRLDHALTKTVHLFGRYNYSPSKYTQRGGLSDSLNSQYTAAITVHTTTVGATWTASSQAANDFRLNYSSSGGSSIFRMDTFGGGSAPPAISLLPIPFSFNDARFSFRILGGTNMQYFMGKNTANFQHQYNLVDTLSIQKGSHSLKFGMDYRRLSPQFAPASYAQTAIFRNVVAAVAGNILVEQLTSTADATLLFKNLGLFAQDNWRVAPRLTLTYGLRWDVDFTPSTESGPSLVSVTGFNLNDFSQLALGPAGKAIYNTKYGNFAPRIGAAYQLSQNPSWGLVLRGGFGVFYDLASSEVGNNLGFAYPFVENSFRRGGTFPLSPSATAPPPIVPPGPNPAQGPLISFDPNLKLPYTLQWNIAVQQALGNSQTLSASYVGSAGKRLLATESIGAPNPNYGGANIVTNGGTSSYNALQVQFQRRLSHGLQTLASYTWSHSIDDGSYGAYANGSIVNLSANKADSDFDIRHNFSAALTYDVPAPKINAFADAILRGWSTENIIQVHSAPPVDVTDDAFFALLNNNSAVTIRPDRVPDQPLYLHSSSYPGGKAINPNALTDPPVDPNTGNPIRQGNLGRNALRGFGLTQWDFAVHRDFPIRESLKLQFRAEMFNVLNHPNFGPFNSSFGVGDPFFGQATQMLGGSLSGTPGNGGFNALYQIGGPRSIQLALKLQF